jgi:hypothetical protein
MIAKSKKQRIIDIAKNLDPVKAKYLKRAIGFYNDRQLNKYIIASVFLESGFDITMVSHVIGLLNQRKT